MKKTLLTVVAAFSFTAMVSAQSQTMKTNPLAMAFGSVNLTYETVLTRSSSLNLSANYQYRFNGIDVNAYGLGVGWRYFFTHPIKPVPAGFYIQPQAGVIYGTVDEFNYITIGVEAEIGYQWIWGRRFVLDLGVGPMYTILNGDLDDIGFNRGGGISPSATVAIGYAF